MGDAIRIVIMRVAAIQSRPLFKQPRENLIQLTKLIKEAKRYGSDIVTCPELANVGYSFLSKEEALPFAEVVEPPNGPIRSDKSIHVMSLLARRWDINIVWGFIELDPLTGKMYNAQALVEPTGRITCYQKINRFGNDFIVFAKGQKTPPVVTIPIDGRDWRIGLLICRDIRDKAGNSDVSFYEPGAADVVCYSANWGKGGYPATAWMDFVEDNKIPLVVSNRYGQEENNDFGDGGICVISAQGEVNTKGLIWGQDCIVYGDF